MSIKRSVGVWQAQRQTSVRGHVQALGLTGKVKIKLNEDMVCCGCKPSGQVTGLLFGFC